MATKPKILISHPTGNANLRAVIDAAEKDKLLLEFHTSIAFNPNSAWLKLLPAKISKDLRRREFSIPPQLIKTHPLREVGRMVSTKTGLTNLTRHEKGVFSVDAVYHNLDAAVAKRLKSNSEVDAVYAYEDGAEASFKIAKDLNIKCFYDLPIGYWRAFHHLMEKELKERPEWTATLTGLKDSTEKHHRKDKELALADHIFVASSFTKKTLDYFNGSLAQVSVIPYGFPEAAMDRIYQPFKNRPLKLLFVGGLSQRKGIANIFEAVDELKNSVELTVIGRKTTENCEALNRALKNHRYIPSLPHDQVLAEMRAHDILVFPSLFEGFGLVVTESMSQGTPVIASDRTCAPDVITHGQNGWIVESGNTKALVSQIEEILQNPDIIEVAGHNALKTAENRPWTEYGHELSEKLRMLLQQ